jgi:hypothetical protein
VLKYVKFALRFILTYYYHKTYPYFGSLPYYKTVKVGTVAHVISGGQFKITDKYVLTKVGWVKFESNEAEIQNTKEYKAQQEEIRQEFRRLKLNDDNYNIKL